tara:strand:- start:286 stop:582 length:297 start_codon:yes stop_codon:yes gene_type:complete
MPEFSLGSSKARGLGPELAFYGKSSITLTMKELIFEVTEDLEGGYVASALGVGIHTQAETVEELKVMVRDALECYFGDRDDKPALIRLHFVRDEVLAV